jgi:hypothetical protein
MKKILAVLLEYARRRFARERVAFHDDSLRANQPERAATFSYWRALVS